MRSTPIPVLILLAGALTAADELNKEPMQVGADKVPVANLKELTMNYRNDDPDLKIRELWYSSYDGDSWSKWQKHGVNYDRGAPISWEPPEGHWRIYIRITKVSGLQDEQPGKETEAMKEFIIDRTDPVVKITAPGQGVKLRAGAPTTISWSANDHHLHSTPITIKWARDPEKDFEVIAEHIKNTGSFKWTTPRDMTESGTIRVEAADKALNVGNAEITNITVDAIAPSRNILGPAVSDSREVELKIKALDAGPAGLATVKLWYSQDKDRTWIEGPSLDEGEFEKLAWKAPGNGQFLLNLQAADEAGNITDSPKKADDALFTVIVDDEKPEVGLDNTIGVVDADAKANAVLRRVFKPGDEVRIPVTIKDANLIDNGVAYLLQVEKNAPWKTLGEKRDPTKPFTFEIPDVDSKECRVKVVVRDLAGNVGEAVSTEAFRIDNKIEKGEVEIEGLDL